jgi:cytochrome c biogenesis protein CcmG/thiol:disulfide interchange protein DsbE
MSRAKAAPRPANRRTLILYATIAVVVIAAIIAVAMASRVPQSAQTINKKAELKVGQDAPPFTASTTSGPFNLATVTTPVLLEVFATWCPHCQREVPVINALAKQYAGKVAFVGVSGSPYGVDGSSPENQADVMQFVQKLGVAYPVAFDPELKVANAYLQGGYPTLVIIDAKKKIRYIADGEIAPQALSKAIDGVLSSPS